MTDLQPHPTPAHGWLIAISALLGTVLTPVAVWSATLVSNQIDLMCGTGGGKGGIACAIRVFVAPVMTILPGLLDRRRQGTTMASRRKVAFVTRFPCRARRVFAKYICSAGFGFDRLPQSMVVLKYRNTA
jgi:hypothetical protein